MATGCPAPYITKLYAGLRSVTPELIGGTIAGGATYIHTGDLKAAAGAAALGMMGGSLARLSSGIRNFADPRRGVCFAPFTLVDTPDGQKPIADIQAGELVLSRTDDDPNGPIEAKVVEEVFVRTGILWRLRFAGRELFCTAEHPFYVHGQGWTSASHLHSGQRLSTDCGEWVSVESIECTDVESEVYNFRVAEYHTYFVGGTGWGFSVWAHNTYAARTQQQAEDELFNIMMVGQDASNANAIRKSARNLAAWGARDGFDGDPWFDTIVNHPQRTPLALLMGDSNPDFLLSIPNAEAALVGPAGSTLRVKGAGGQGADLVFEADGAVVFGREAKSTLGEWRSIEGHFSKAKGQIGADTAGDIYMQMPNTTTAEAADKIARRLAGMRNAPEKRAPYANKTLTIVNEDGQVLHHGPAVP
jgi:hypothetical protein